MSGKGVLAQSDGGVIEARGTLQTLLAAGNVTGNLTVLISGQGAQTFAGSGIENVGGFGDIILDKPSGNLVLDGLTPLASSIALVRGAVVSSQANLLALGPFATVTGASANSYIEGPVKKTGNTAFTFPTGRNGNYQPISISAPALTTDAFTAEYFDIRQMVLLLPPVL